MVDQDYDKVPVAEIQSEVDDGMQANDGRSDGSEKSTEDPASEAPLQQERKVLTVDDAIELLGMGKCQLLLSLAAGLCFASDAMQIIMLSFLSKILKAEWKLSDSETALITSTLFTGAIFGTLILGSLADRKGRKPIFTIGAAIISFFGFGVGFVTTYWSLLVVLFIVGIGVGSATVPYDILAEFLPAESRGKYLQLLNYYWTLGVLFVVVVAHITLGDGQHKGSWTVFVQLCALPCFLALILSLTIVPESPRWLCSQGRCDEALDIIRKAADLNGLDPEFLFPEYVKLAEEEEEGSSFSELFSSRWLWTTMKVLGTWAAFAFSYYGTVLITTDVFDSTESNAEGNDTYNFDYSAIFVSSSSELIGITLIYFAIDTYGRIPLQAGSYALAGICLFAFCTLAHYNAERTILVALGFAARIFEMTGSIVTWVSTTEIFTTEVRSTGHSTANAAAKIAILFVAFITESEISMFYKGIVFLIVHAMAVIFVSQLPETKGSHMGHHAIESQVD